MEVKMEEQAPAAPAISLSDSIMNVFASPATAFEGLGNTRPSSMLWVTPLIVILLCVVLFSYVFSTNETFHGQIVDAQTQAMNKAVQNGKMTQEQADRAEESMQKMGGMFMVFGIVAGTIFVLIYLFAGSLVLWLANKLILKSPVGYGKHLEMYGISHWIGILGTIITLLLMYALNSMYASPSAALAVISSYDLNNTTHKILSVINIFAIWQCAVVGVGLSKLSGKSIGSGVGVAFVLWILWLVVSVSLGINR
jgi:hypothetical protein